ncbi:MAG: diaminopimelate epimerase [Frankiaceae bacterium]
MSDQGLPFVKGHGTENDIVLLPDLDAALDLPAAVVRAICDRRAGIGADGLIRVVPTAAVPEVAHLASGAPWFMDYRNGDGSVVEMCGNGVRVLARYLVTAGLVAPGTFEVATRDGVKRLTVTAPDDDVAVDMGPPRLLGMEEVHVVVADRRYLGMAISMGNPHLVVPVADLAEAGDLAAVPPVDPPEAFPDGVNVEFVLGRGPGRIAMRVHERGVGETRSCGTGACAAAVAAGRWWEPGRPVRCAVDLPGGRLTVVEEADGHLSLSGNAVLVAEGRLRPSWLAAMTDAAGEPVEAGRAG